MLSRWLILSALVALVTGCKKTVAELPHPMRISASVATSNATWAVPEWDFDFANVTGCADDNNTCQSVTCGNSGVGPCRSYREVSSRRWGTTNPQIKQPSLILRILSSHSDNTDPIKFDPDIVAGARISIQGVPDTSICGSGATLANVTSLVRGTNLTLAQVNLSGGAACDLAVNELVCDTTHPACAWTYAVSSGNVWELTAPFVPHVAGSGDTTNPIPASFTEGDAVTVMKLPEANIVEVSPSYYDNDPTATNYPEIDRVSIYDPQGSVHDYAWIGANVYVIESSTKRMLLGVGSTSIGGQRWFLNDNNLAGIEIDSGPSNLATQVVGGQLQNNAYFRGLASIDGDVIVNTFNPLTFDGEVIAAATRIATQGPIVGNVYIESGKNVILSGSGSFASRFGAGVVYGPGALNIMGASRWVYPAGAGQAAATFKQTGGFQLNGQTSAWLMLTGSPPVVGKTLNPAAIDTDLGPVVGAYWNPGGASISNGKL
jgi:hypothetical protein